MPKEKRPIMIHFKATEEEMNRIIERISIRKAQKLFMSKQNLIVMTDTLAIRNYPVEMSVRVVGNADMALMMTKPRMKSYTTVQWMRANLRTWTNMAVPMKRLKKYGSENSTGRWMKILKSAASTVNTQSMLVYSAA